MFLPFCREFCIDSFVCFLFLFSWHYIDSGSLSVFVERHIDMCACTCTHTRIPLPEKVPVDLLSLGKSASSALEMLALVAAGGRPRRAAGDKLDAGSRPCRYDHGKLAGSRCARRCCHRWGRAASARSLPPALGAPG